MKLLFLGTGTSTGVPQIGCSCEVCKSIDPCDKRLRASAILEIDSKRILIDCGPDLRTQLLKANSPNLDCMIVTHSHYDHVGGIDDLRPYCVKTPFPIYCRADVAEDLRNRVPYCFYEHKYPGVPTFDLNIVNPDTPFTVLENIEITPLPVMHYKLPILGYRIRNFAYITDCKEMPSSTLELLKGVDTLVINALRHKPHLSHQTLEEAIEIAKKTGCRKTYFTHMSHEIGLASQTELPPNMMLAHDFMTIDIPE